MAQFIPAKPFDLVIFGGTGDLARRKLLPALYRRDRDRQFSDDSRIFASSRRSMEREDFLNLVREALLAHLGAEELDEETWQRFSSRLHFHQQDVTAAEGWEGLEEKLSGQREKVRVFYLAMIPSLTPRLPVTWPAPGWSMRRRESCWKNR